MPGGSICGMFDVVFPTELETSNADMGQYISRTGFDSLLAKTHVQHALIQPDGRHNDVPTVGAFHLLPSCKTVGDTDFQPD